MALKLGGLTHRRDIRPDNLSNTLVGLVERGSGITCHALARRVQS